MQLATVSSGQPWLCTVYFVADDDLNVYWSSTKTRRHSKELLAHPQVAVAIVKDQDRKQGMQITGLGSLVGDDDVERVNKLYGDKFGHKPERMNEVRAGTRGFWKVTPNLIALWDEVNFPDSPKQEYRL